MKHLLTSALTLTVFSLAACAEAGPGPDMKEDDVKRIIQEYLIENPEIIREALIALERKDARAEILSVAAELRNDPRDFSVGPKDAKVTVVEFFDYNCGFCARTTDWVKTVMEEHPNDVRVVFKELPILDSRSKTSRNASKAALAAARQGKYIDMHFDLMDARGLSAERIEDIAKDNGLDLAKFKADIKDLSIDEHINDTLVLANRIPSLTGTPFFVINDDFVSGADTDRLQALLDSALQN